MNQQTRKTKLITLILILAAMTLMTVMACGGEEAVPEEPEAESLELIEWPEDTPEAETPAAEAQETETPTEPTATAALTDELTRTPTPEPTRPVRPEAPIPTITPAPTIPLMIPRPTAVRAETPAPAITTTPGATATPLPARTPTPTPGPTATTDPDLAEAMKMAEVARTMLAGGEYDGALATLSEAEQLLGRLTPWISPLMADAMVGQGRDEQAAGFYTHAIDHNPRNGEYRVKRASIRLRQDNTDAAEHDALEATRLEPSRWEIHRGPHRLDSRAEASRILTELYVQSQDYEEAHRHANAALTAAVVAGYPASVQERLKDRKEWLQDVLRAREKEG